MDVNPAPVAAQPAAGLAELSMLNEGLRQVVSACICRAEHSCAFLTPCSAPDYQEFVSASEDMNLQRILAKTRDFSYTSVAQFSQDFESIRTNTQKYHDGKAGGREAKHEMAQWAQELQQACRAELELRPELLGIATDGTTDADSAHKVLQPSELALLNVRCPTHLSLGSDQHQQDLQQHAATDSLQGSDTSQQEQEHRTGPLSDAQHLGLPTDTAMPNSNGCGPGSRLELPDARPRPDRSQSASQPSAVSQQEPFQAHAYLEYRLEQEQLLQQQQGSHSHESSEHDEGEDGSEDLVLGITAPATVTDPSYKRRQLAAVDESGPVAQGMAPPVRASSLARAFSGPTGTSALSSLEALVAACELAAEKEGLDDDCHYYEELVAESPAFGRAAAAGQIVPYITADLPSRPAPAIANGRAHPRNREAEADATYLPPASGNAGNAWSGQAGGNGVDAAACPKYRRHKSKVFIRPNKVVYLPTTFMEEAFDPASLPMNCEMVVEADGSMVLGEKHFVTIKAVPRQGLSTMYCMTNVMKFQQQYLNWQLLNWTKMDDNHIKIHLQSPNSGPSSGMPRTSSGPVPRTVTAQRTGSGCGAAAMDDYLGSGNGPEADGLRSLSSNGTDYDMMPRSGSGQGTGAAGGGAEVVRRSARSVRLTSQMVEHLQQERQVQAEKSLRAHVSPHASGSPVSPGTAGSHKRRSEFGPDALEGAVKTESVAPQAAVHYPGRNYQYHYAQQQQQPASTNPHAASLASLMYGGGYMEGSQTANLYYMPPSGGSKSAAQANVSLASDGPGSNNGGSQGGARGGMARTASAAAPGTARQVNGPRCIVTPGNPGTGTSNLVMGIPRLPGALAMFGSSAAYPLTGGCADAGSGDYNQKLVGMLGPSIPSVGSPSPPPTLQQLGAGPQGEQHGPGSNGGAVSNGEANAHCSAANVSDGGGSTSMDSATVLRPGTMQLESNSGPLLQSPGSSEAGISDQPSATPCKRSRTDSHSVVDTPMTDGAGVDHAAPATAPSPLPQVAVPPPRNPSGNCSIVIGSTASGIRTYTSCPGGASQPLMLGTATTNGHLGPLGALLSSFGQLPPGAQLQLQPQHLAMLGLNPGNLHGFNPQQALGLIARGVYTQGPQPVGAATPFMAAATASGAGRTSMPEMSTFPVPVMGASKQA